MLAKPARPVELRLPLLCDPDNEAAQYAAARAAVAEAIDTTGPIAEVLAAMGQTPEARRLSTRLALSFIDLAQPAIAEAAAAAGLETDQAKGVAEHAGKALRSSAVLTHRAHGALAAVSVAQALNAYRVTGDPSALIDRDPPGAHVVIRPVSDWQAIEADARASLKPCPAEGEVASRRASLLGHESALASDGDSELHLARQLDALTPAQRTAAAEYDRWLAGYYRAMAERLVLRVELPGVIDASGGVQKVPDEACEARGKRFPVAAFEEHVEAGEVWAEAVELARARCAPGKARRWHGSASGRASRSEEGSPPPGGPVPNASPTAAAG